MHTIANNTLNLTVNVSVPSSAEEYDQLAGRVGACVEAANYNIVYRSWNNKFRDAFSDFLEASTGIKRHTEPVMSKDGTTQKKDEDGEPMVRYSETAADHVDRVFASEVHAGKAATVEALIAAYLPDAQRIADTIKFDPTERQSNPAAPKKVSKKWIDATIAIEKQGKLAAVAEKLSAIVGYSVPVTIEDVARALVEKAKIDAAREQAALLA